MICRSQYFSFKQKIFIQALTVISRTVLAQSRDSETNEFQLAWHRGPCLPTGAHLMLAPICRCPVHRKKDASDGNNLIPKTAAVENPQAISQSELSHRRNLPLGPDRGSDP